MLPGPQPGGRLGVRAPARGGSLRALLPRGRQLREEVWQQRHAGMLWLLWPHVPAIALFALARGLPASHAMAEVSVIALLAAVATSPVPRPKVRSCAAALGLVVSSSVLVHAADGQTEAHFHFFVVLAFLALYQSWSPYLIALGYVIAQHSVVGWLDPESVFDHPAAFRSPLTWALIHGGFVLAASAASLLAWRLTEHEALHDDLTGLGNRLYLLERLRRAVEQRSACAVLFVDLDDFKSANDGFGHEVGDQLLAVVAQRLDVAVAGQGFVARLGGDEFAVVLLDDDAAATATVVAERLRHELAAPVRLNGRRLTPEASIGVAVLDGRTTSASDLLRNADLAMYAAKDAGGNRVALFAPGMHGDALARAELEAELRQAVPNGELVVHLQPVVEVATGRLLGAEALVRWAHPRRGLLLPGEFVPLAEKSGLISAIGRQVLVEACRHAASWRAASGAPLTVSVNVSSVQLTEPGLLDVVVSALSAAGLEPQALCLELTESSVIGDFDDVVEVLDALKAFGVGLALDDFGTGYSSLSYLHRLPVDCVKIDRSFVRGLDARDDRGVVHAITQLAHSFGLTVTAEGVETVEELAAVRALGVDHAQGFLHGAPVPPAEFAVAVAAAAVPAPRTPEAEVERAC